LHHQALAGSLATVKVLLECGADVNAKTNHGMTAIQLAKSLGWDKVIVLLESKGARS
jgi:ankyrin repeat protein